jgi:electron transfer flavoprotein alpha/beta subunit
MKIIVCLKEVVDPALALDFGLGNPVLFREGLPLRLDPGSATALQKALDIKAAVSGTEIIAVSIGPERVEGYLQEALALGADKAARILDDEPASPYQKAWLLAGAAARWGADAVFTGARSLDTGNGQVGPLVAANLGWPCVSEVVSLAMEGDKTIITVRDIGKGEREKVRCPLPAIVAFKGEGKLPYAPLDRLVESRTAPVTRLAPADLGVSPLELGEEPTLIAGPVFPRPRLRKAPPLDSSLPAFERILQLLEGGISKRRGLMLTGDTDEMVERLFELLKEAGALKPSVR